MNLRAIKHNPFTNINFILGFYLFISTSASIHKFLTHKLANYMTFSTSFWNMFRGINPYYQVLEYKYSPAFCLLMGPMAVLPDWLGAIIWNGINTLILYIGITKLKVENSKKVFILWFIIFEYLTSIQNLQSNVLVTGLILLAFSFFENKKTFWASLVVVLLFFIKIFGAGIGLIFLFYPKKTRFILYSVLWTLVLVFVPLIVVPWDFFLTLYKSWWSVMSTDFSASMGVSLMTIFNMLVNIPKIYIQVAGLVFLLTPIIIELIRSSKPGEFLKSGKFSNYTYRLLFVSSILIWMIIFNHKAESPTYIIAVTGVAIWYVLLNSDRCIRSLDKIFMILVFVFTTLSPTELFPKIIFRFVDYNIVKALPCILVWIKIQYDLYFRKTIIQD
ncbi:MAG: glycosyltransferase family 87 protein [Proteobacteria bacterium]|nr:glycosyltransferase family 87 protein [Pseudomonadota bacterium]